MSVAQHIPDHIKRVSKSLGYSLILENEAAWDGFTTVLRARLSEHERAALAYAVLNSMDPDNAYLTASVALFGTLNGEVVQ
jgi:hypothetical protein